MGSVKRAHQSLLGANLKNYCTSCTATFIQLLIVYTHPMLDKITHAVEQSFSQLATYRSESGYITDQMLLLKSHPRPWGRGLL